MNIEYFLDICHVGDCDTGRYIDCPYNMVFDTAYKYGEYVHDLICNDWI